jgi:two-component system KDP operon response regulator KdpE
MQDTEIRGLLGFALMQKGFQIIEASTVAKGIAIVQNGGAGSVLLDLDAADSGGLAAIKKLREVSQVPILALAGRTDATGVVEALDQGANDFIARPFNIEEISARLRVTRRSARAPAPEVFRSGSLIVDLTRRIVRVGERIVKLTATEYSLLRLFVRHAGLVLTHDQILREVWGSEMLGRLDYLRVYLRALRKKLENPLEPDLFLTERAIGYRLVIREP